MNNDARLTKRIEEPREFKITPVNYKLGKYPHKLKHRRVGFFEKLLSIGANCHRCQICSRIEGNIKPPGWLQIDDPEHKDKDGCSVVCYECWELNPEIFGEFSGLV